MSAHSITTRVEPSTLGRDPATFATSVAYADAAGNPGDSVAHGEFFSLFDATQFATVQAWVFAITRERQHVAVTIVRGGPVAPGEQVLVAAGTASEISDAAGRLLVRETGAR